MTEIKKRRGRPPKAAAAPKRRGRPPKNAVVAQAPERRGRKPKAAVEANVQVVDWEQLAKRLQEALESQIEENKVLFKDNSQLVKDNRNLLAIVAYLESRLAARTNDSV